MCGRFAQALSPREYWDTVEEDLHPRTAGKRGGGREKGNESGAQSRQGTLFAQNDRSKADETNDEEHFLTTSTLGKEDYYPTYNVAPGVQVPIVRMETPRPMRGYGEHAELSDAKAALMIQPMRWGLMPHYTTSIPRGPDAMRTINARDDAVLSGQSMWTPILRKGKRCIVFCQGFYEWLKKDNGATRIAHFVGMTDNGRGRMDVHGVEKALMPMAGLWEQCTIDGEEMYSFTVITTESNQQLNFLHDRMPVILPDKRAMHVWLGIEPASNEEICKLLKPYDQGKLDCYPVPKEVGKVGTNEKSFILPVSSRKDGIAAAFGRAQKKQKEPRCASPERLNEETNAPMDEEIESAKRVEEEFEKKRKRQLSAQEEEDEAFARKLQKEEEDEADLAQRTQAEEDSRTKEEEDKNQRDQSSSSSSSSKKGERDDQSEKEAHKLRPSSKFSPEPYNPPVSPVRPNGGWSSVEHSDPAPYKRSSDNVKSPERSGARGAGAANPVKQRQLQESAKGTKDIRNFFK